MNRYLKSQLQGLSIVFVGFILTLSVYLGLKFSSYSEFIHDEVFTIFLIPIFCAGFGIILSAQFQQDIKLNFFIKLLLGLLIIVWLVLSYLIIGDKIGII